MKQIDDERFKKMKFNRNLMRRRNFRDYYSFISNFANTMASTIMVIIHYLNHHLFANDDEVEEEEEEEKVEGIIIIMR
jgi:hypothetical protein